VGELYQGVGGTAGVYALVEFVTAPNPGRVPPPHRHPNLDEGFYVIEGALTMLLGDRTVTVAAPGGPDQKRLTALYEKYEIQQLS
jgi:quercetin dioxygenase-like cupin family protein